MKALDNKQRRILKDYDTQNQANKIKLDTKDDEIQIFQATQDSLEASISSLNADKLMYKTQISQLSTQKAAIEKKLTDLKKKFQHYKSSEIKIENAIAHPNDQSQSKLIAKTAILQQMEKQSQVNELQINYFNLEHDHQTLTGQHNSLQQREASLFRELDDLQVKHSIQNKDLSDKNHQIQLMNDAGYNLQIDNENLKKQVEDLDAKIDDIETDIQAKTNEVEAKDDEIQVHKGKFESIEAMNTTLQAEKWQVQPATKADFYIINNWKINKNQIHCNDQQSDLKNDVSKTAILQQMGKNQDLMSNKREKHYSDLASNAQSETSKRDFSQQEFRDDNDDEECKSASTLSASSQSQFRGLDNQALRLKPDGRDFGSFKSQNTNNGDFCLGRQNVGNAKNQGIACNTFGKENIAEQNKNHSTYQQQQKETWTSLRTEKSVFQIFRDNMQGMKNVSPDQALNKFDNSQAFKYMNQLQLSCFGSHQNLFDQPSESKSDDTLNGEVIEKSTDFSNSIVSFGSRELAQRNDGTLA
eukprot:403339171